MTTAGFLHRVAVFMLVLPVFVHSVQAGEDGVESREDRPVPPICPRWAFEPWVWEDNGNTRASTLGLVRAYRQRDIPVGVVIVDSPWQTAYHSYEWDRVRYPNPAGMIKTLHAEGTRVLLWMTGAQNIEGKDTPQNQSPYFEYAVENGFTVNKGKTFDWWKGTGTYIDFSLPAAVEWYGTHIAGLMDMGIDGFKVDQTAHYIPEPVDTSIGMLSRSEFKPHYYAALHDLALGHNPDSLILARPFSHQGGFAAGIDKCTVGWGGDYLGNWEGLSLQMHDVYKSAAVGYGTLCVEVGGYFKVAPDKESLIRYTQFGALMPVMCNGGSNGELRERLLWHWDDQTVEIYRCYAVLHSELAPYLFSASVDAHLHGGSVVKSPDYECRQHMLGNQLFISPVTSPGPVKRVQLPEEGLWIDYWNEGALHPAGTAMEVQVPLERIPIYIRAGAIIPMKVRSPITGHADATREEKDTVLIYPCGKSTYQYHRPAAPVLNMTVCTSAWMNRVDG